MENLPMMKLTLETDWSKLVPVDKVHDIFDEGFIKNIEMEIEKLNPACSFIDFAQAKNCTAAEAVHKWLQMSVIDGYYRDWLKRDKMVCNLSSMIAYSLHPKMKGELLTNSQRNQVEVALYNNGRGESLLTQYISFQKATGSFGDYDALQLKPMMYWNLMSFEYPELSKIAITYLSLPASSASLERVFSMWNYVHNKSRNRLSKKTSEDLIFVYHAIHSMTQEVFEKLYTN